MYVRRVTAAAKGRKRERKKKRGKNIYIGEKNCMGKTTSVWLPLSRFSTKVQSLRVRVCYTYVWINSLIPSFSSRSLRGASYYAASILSLSLSSALAKFHRQIQVWHVRRFAFVGAITNMQICQRWKERQAESASFIPRSTTMPKGVVYSIESLLCARNVISHSRESRFCKFAKIFDACWFYRTWILRALFFSLSFSNRLTFPTFVLYKIVSNDAHRVERESRESIGKSIFVDLKCAPYYLPFHSSGQYVQYVYQSIAVSFKGIETS